MQKVDSDIYDTNKAIYRNFSVFDTSGRGLLTTHLFKMLISILQKK